MMKPYERNGAHRSTLSKCFCWNLPLTMRQLLPSIDPVVPSSAMRNCNGILSPQRMRVVRYLQHVLRVSLEEFADIVEVDEGRLLTSSSVHLRRLHSELLLVSREFRVLLSHNVKDDRKHLFIRVVRPRSSSINQVRPSDSCGVNALVSNYDISP